MLNHVALMGRVTHDPELRRTQSGKSVCSFSLAVQRDYAAPGADKETDFFDCTVWDKSADFFCANFAKGQMCSVLGRLQNRKWQDKNGNNRINTEIQVDRVYFCVGKYENGGTAQFAPASGGVPAGFQEITEDDPDLPF